MSTWWTCYDERCFSVMKILKYIRPIGLHTETDISRKRDKQLLIGLNRKLDFVLRQSSCHRLVTFSISKYNGHVTQVNKI